MFERTVNLEIDKAYADLKAVLFEKGCKIIYEEPPERILVKQGSIWGMSPTTAKKTVKFNLISVDAGTQVTCSSRLSSDWKNISIIGCVLAAVLIGVCLWMAFDLGAFMVSRKPSFWSWLITVSGNIDFQIGKALVSLTEGLAVLLSGIIVLEIVLLVYVHGRIERFAEEALNSVANHDFG